MRVELRTDVEDAAALDQRPKGRGAAPVFRGSREEQALEDERVGRRRPRTRLTPLAVAVPTDEAEESFVHLLNQPVDPVEPEGLEPIDRRPANPRPAGRRTQPLLECLGRGLVAVAIAPEGQTAIGPGTIRLVADAPEPPGQRPAAESP